MKSYLHLSPELFNKVRTLTTEYELTFGPDRAPHRALGAIGVWAPVGVTEIELVVVRNMQPPYFRSERQTDAK